MNKKKNLVVMIIMQIAILLYTIMIFTVPLMKRSVNFAKFYNEQEKSYVDNILSSVSNCKLMELEDQFIPTKDLDKGLLKVNNFFESNKIENSKMVACRFNSFISSKKKSRTVRFEYELKMKSGKFFLLAIELYTENNKMKIKALNVAAIPKSLKEINSFYGDKIDIARIFILLISVLLMLFIAYSEYDYYKTIQKPKILIQILMPLSIGQIVINWNSLAISFTPIAINIMPLSSFSSGLVGVWKYMISILIVLIIYWFSIRRKAILQADLAEFAPKANTTEEEKSEKTEE